MTSVSISLVSAKDQEEFLAAVAASGALHQHWVSPPNNAAAFAKHLQKYSAENNESFVASDANGDLLGCININAIVRGAFQSAYLGYDAFAPHSGTGAMKQALSTVITHAFADLRLHRLEANIQPENSSSIGLVKALGFRREGFSPPIPEDQRPMAGS